MVTFRLCLKDRQARSTAARRSVGTVRMGVRATTISSDNMDDWTAVEGKLAKGKIDILLISPERLANERFCTQVLAGIAA